MFQRIAILGLLLIINSSCSQSSKKFSGYITLKSEISSGSVAQAFMPPAVLIVDAQANAIEFLTKVKLENGEMKGSDTLNVFFINFKKGNYASYKKLDINEKPYAKEKIDNKKEGISFFSKKVDFFSGVTDIVIKDSIIKNISYKVARGFKKVDHYKFKYEAYVLNSPKKFPIQISKIISERTEGGFVAEVRITDYANDKLLIFKCDYIQKNLPERLEKLMKVWGGN
ncbi:hypothetical protein [Flavobacterium notoginsengisoli]|uniref:hypothetical protein n=1 Tax=Flavobacterium notoginsengisoli TaxID=1478199 RepID=UPI0036380973